MLLSSSCKASALHLIIPQIPQSIKSVVNSFQVFLIIEKGYFFVGIWEKLIFLRLLVLSTVGSNLYTVLKKNLYFCYYKNSGGLELSFVLLSVSGDE